MCYRLTRKGTLKIIVIDFLGRLSLVKSALKPGCSRGNFENSRTTEV